MTSYVVRVAVRGVVSKALLGLQAKPTPCVVSNNRVQENAVMHTYNSIHGKTKAK